MKPRVLLVDDEASVLTILKSYLSRQGYEVHTASELEEAQALLAHIDYSVVISDLRMTAVHGAEGFELLAFAAQKRPSSRRVMLTGCLTSEVAREARARGADVVLGKPTSLPDIARIVSELSESARDSEPQITAGAGRS
ncbi:MAG: response regulator [Myxococcales bacterium]|nr:response regulator [Myxococcales bacterium]